VGVSSEYRSAAVCRRGHVASADLTASEYGPKCSQCGADVLIQCSACGRRIRGETVVAGAYHVGGETPPDFCDNCGAAFPWIGRQALIYELQNRLEGQQLDPADALTVREQLDALLSPELDVAEQRERWGRVKKLAPVLWQTSQPLIETLATAAVRAAI
jgi:hypothetical protein